MHKKIGFVLEFRHLQFLVARDYPPDTGGKSTAVVLLDGAPTTLRDLALAAAAEGVAIPYPGIAPLATAHGGGPSASGAPPATDFRGRTLT